MTAYHRRIGIPFIVIGCLLALLASSAMGSVTGTETNVFESLSVVIIEGQQTLSGVDANSLRSSMDALGNNNDHVESAEVASFETMYEDYVREHANEYTLNGIEGNFTNIVATFKDAEGPVNSANSIDFEYQGRIAFGGLDTDLGSYTYRVVNEGGVYESITFQLTVPSGYEITHTQGIIVPQTSASKRTVSGSTLIDSNIVIDFRKADEGGWLFWSLLISGLVSAIIVAVIAAANYTDVFDRRKASEEDSDIFGEKGEIFK